LRKLLENKIYKISKEKITLEKKSKTKSESKILWEEKAYKKSQHSLNRGRSETELCYFP